MDAIFIIQIIFFLIFLFILIGMLVKAYYFSIIVKFIYSSTNNLFVTITLVAAIIFFGIALYETTPEKKDEDKNKGFLETGGLYYIISAVLFIVSFIINLISKRNQPTTIKTNQPTTIKTNQPTTIKTNISKKI